MSSVCVHYCHIDPRYPDTLLDRHIDIYASFAGCPRSYSKALPVALLSLSTSFRAHAHNGSNDAADFLMMLQDDVVP